jgi:PKHD-type hydroxylase
MLSTTEGSRAASPATSSFLLPAAMCDQAIAIATRTGWERGRVERMEEDEPDTLRRCDSCFLLPNSDAQPLYDTIAAYFRTHDVGSTERLREMPQIARYRPGDHFDWHQDANESVRHRKHTLSIQLSDPSEYQGGELELDDGTIAPQTRGTAFLFPAQTWHRVRPITAGRRIALVAWSTYQTNRTEQTTYRSPFNDNTEIHRLRSSAQHSIPV